MSFQSTSITKLPPYPLWLADDISELHRACNPGPRGSVCIPSNARVERVDPARDGEQALKIKSRSNTGPTGGLSSMKTSSVVHWKSPAEGHLLKLLECDWRVTHFKSQPVTVFYTLDGIETQRHIPDALALGGPYPVLFEVKTERDAWREDLALRSSLMARDLPTFGYAYRVVLAEDLRLEPRMANLKYIRRLGRQPLEPVVREAARQLFRLVRAFTWEQVDRGELGPITLPVVCRLILEGELWVDVDSALEPGTVVRYKPRSSGVACDV